MLGMRLFRLSYLGAYSLLAVSHYIPRNPLANRVREKIVSLVLPELFARHRVIIITGVTETFAEFYKCWLAATLTSQSTLEGY